MTVAAAPSFLLKLSAIWTDTSDVGNPAGSYAFVLRPGSEELIEALSMTAPMACLRVEVVTDDPALHIAIASFCLSDDGGRDVVRVGDSTQELVDIAIVACTPAACQDALLRSGQDGVSLLSRDRLRLLPAYVALRAVRITLIDNIVRDVASELPQLPSRDRRVLEAIIAGQSSKQIARGMGVSQATVNRCTASLVSLFAVGGRFELAGVALEHGYRAKRAERPTAWRPTS